MDINALVTEIGSGATTSASEVAAGPVGDIIFWVVGLTLIGFAVSVIFKYLKN